MGFTLMQLLRKPHYVYGYSPITDPITKMRVAHAFEPYAQSQAVNHRYSRATGTYEDMRNGPHKFLVVNSITEDKHYTVHTT